VIKKKFWQSYQRKPGDELNAIFPIFFQNTKKELKMTKIKEFILLLTLLLLSLCVFAGNASAFSLPGDEDIQIKFNNWDYFSPFPIPPQDLDILDPYSGAEYSWNVMEFKSMDHSPYTGANDWVSGQNGEYITGIMYDLKLGLATLDAGTGELSLFLYGGKMNFYLDDDDIAGYTEANPVLGPGARSSATTFPTFTDSNVSANPFLSIDLASGIVPVDPLGAFGGTTFHITVSANNAVNSASGDTYADVTGGDYGWLFDTNSITGGHDFNLGFHGNGPGSWGWSADTFDPAFGRTAVPEPTTFALFGLGLLGMAGIVRRKTNG